MVCALLKIGKRHFGFVGTHLDAKSEAKRAKLARQIAEHVAKWYGSPLRNLNFFVMGDLNYRMVRIHDPSPLTEAESRSIMDQLRTPEGRKLLLSHDAFSMDDEAQFRNGLGKTNGPRALLPLELKWLPHGPNCLPTYKRTVKTSHPGYRAWRKIMTSPQFLKRGVLSAENGISEKDITQALDVYLKKGMLTQKRAGFYDFGWLDRIGYRLAPPVRLGRNQLAVLNTFMDVTGGDHVPTYTLLTLSGLN